MKNFGRNQASSVASSFKRNNVFKPVTVPGFFDEQQQREMLTKCGDPLVVLDGLIDWEIFRSQLTKLFKKDPNKKTLGRKPIDPILMFKVLILQRLYSLSDEQTEFQIRDRASFQRFLGIFAASGSPDAKTVWFFRERLNEENIAGELFLIFDKELASHGMVAQGGQMIDASFVEVPRQRNTPEENEEVKAGRVPETWQNHPAKLSQKDLDARWTKKGDDDYYGYKNHINADAKHKFIRSYLVTAASVHDSQAFDDLLLPIAMGKKVYADSAYRSAACDEKLRQALYENKICRKAHRNKSLTKQQVSWNHRWSQTRCRVEHIFAAMFQIKRGSAHILNIGLERAITVIGLANLTYNLQRFCQILRSRSAVVIG
jgi:IS5 family transposase